MLDDIQSRQSAGSILLVFLPNIDRGFCQQIKRAGIARLFNRILFLIAAEISDVEQLRDSEKRISVSE